MLSGQSTTKDYIRAEHKLHSTSKSFISQVIIPQVMFFLACLCSVGSQHGHLHSAGWPILFCGPTQEPVLATANTGENRERFGKNAGERTRRAEISKEEIPGSKRSIGFKGRMFKLCVLTRWGFNFCICSSPLWDSLWYSMCHWCLWRTINIHISHIPLI